MSRRRKAEGEAVSLFPFLSILACVIGTLTLMITALALGQIDEAEAPEAKARIEAAEQVAFQREFDEAALEQAERQIADQLKLREQLRLAKQEVDRLEEEKQETLSADAREHAEELARLAKLRMRIEELEAELPELAQLLEDLQRQIEEKANPKEAEVVVRPGGSGYDLVPTFVEVTATGVVIHEGGEPERLLRGDLDKEGGRFHQLLDTVAGTPKGTLVFLLREDGIATYGTATRVCNTHYGPNGYCPHGKLPIVGQGRIDLKLFEASSTQ